MQIAEILPVPMRQRAGFLARFLSHLSSLSYHRKRVFQSFMGPTTAFVGVSSWIWVVDLVFLGKFICPLKFYGSDNSFRRGFFVDLGCRPSVFREVYVRLIFGGILCP